MMWDDEVDVVCTGSGVGALAQAIAAADAGLDVYVANSAVDHGVSRVGQPFNGLGGSVVDPETNEYFAALSADLGPLNPSPRDCAVPVRVVEPLPPADKGRAVEPFYGARLKGWAAQCLVSPYGFLYTRISGPDTTLMRTSAGEIVEAVVVGALDPGADVVAGMALNDWLTTQARVRGIEASPNSSLQRIVFDDDGEVAGAVLTSPDGPYAVRARHGVAMTTSGPLGSAVPTTLTGYESVQVGLVRQTASRFGRLELLATASPSISAMPTCRAVNRQLRHTLRDSKQARSQAWRCRKVHGNPPLGQ